jgi:hypothetical protein
MKTKAVKAQPIKNVPPKSVTNGTATTTVSVVAGGPDTTNSDAAHAADRHAADDARPTNRATTAEANMAKESLKHTTSASEAPAPFLDETSPVALAAASAAVCPPEQPASSGGSNAGVRKSKSGKATVVRFTPPLDAEDMTGLFDDPLLGDGLTDPEELLSVSLGKPKGKFVRVHPDKNFRRRAYVFVRKEEGEFGEEFFIIDKSMVKHMKEDAQPVVLAVYVDRANNPGIWVLKLPRPDQEDHPVWKSARMAARKCIDIWGKPMWTGRGYKVRPAAAGYAADPPWCKLPSFEELLSLAAGPDGIIKSFEHPVYRDNIGLPPLEELESTDDGSDDDEVV